MAAGQSHTLPLMELFVTSHFLTPSTRARHETAHRLLAPFTSLIVRDVAALDEPARRRYKQKGGNELPLLLVNGVRISIEDLQLAADDGRLREALRLDNPPSRPSVDDDLGDLTDEQADQLLDAFDREKSIKPPVVMPMTPPETPKVGSSESPRSAQSAAKAGLPSNIVMPFTPPMTPETPGSSRFTTPVLASAPWSAPAVPSPQTSEPVGLPSSPRRVRVASDKPLRIKSSKDSLPQVPLSIRTPGHSPNASLSSTSSHRRRASSLRQISQAAAVRPQTPVTPGHKSKQSSLAELYAAIDDAISQHSSPAASPVKSTNEPDVQLKDFLRASPNNEAADQGGENAALMDVSGLAGAYDGLATETKPVAMASRMSSIDFRDAPLPPKSPQRSLPHYRSPPAQVHKKPKKSGLFGCFSKSAANAFDD